MEQTSGRPAVTISPDFSPQTASPAGVSKSKVSMSGAAKGKINQNKKKDDRTSRHNLALVNLRFDTFLFVFVDSVFSFILYIIFYCRGLFPLKKTHV